MILGESFPCVPVAFPVIIHGQFHVFKSVIRTDGGKVHLALRPCLVAGLGKKARQRGVLRHRPELIVVAHQPGIVAMQAGHDGGPGSHADGAVRVAAGIGDAFIHQPVQMGCEDVLVSKGMNGVESLLVRCDEQNIGTSAIFTCAHWLLLVNAPGYLFPKPEWCLRTLYGMRGRLQRGQEGLACKYGISYLQTSG